MKNFHYQNLNDSTPKKYLSHGRCWLNPFRLEWAIPSGTFQFKIELASHEDALQLSFGIGLFTVYLSYDNYKLATFIQNKTKRKSERYGNGRTIGVAIHHGSIWIDLWRDPISWHSEDPKWWEFNINVKDIFFGKEKYSRRVLETRDVEVPMPERSYKAKAQLCLDTWSRSRWFSKSIKRIDIELNEGIPHEGKGENSWDCGVDATHSYCAQADSIPEGVGRLVGSVLDSRVRYGGWGDWNFKKEIV